MFKHLLAICLALALVGDALAVNPTCTKYDKQRSIVQNERWREAPIGRGISMNGLMIELYRLKDGSTWTLLYTNPNGQSCVLQAGQGWEDISWQDPRGKRL